MLQTGWPFQKLNSNEINFVGIFERKSSYWAMLKLKSIDELLREKSFALTIPPSNNEIESFH